MRKLLQVLKKTILSEICYVHVTLRLVTKNNVCSLIEPKKKLTIVISGSDCRHKENKI